MIVYEFGKDGSFVAGDTVTGRTVYAYPASSNATQARRKGKALPTAQAMMKKENALGDWRSSWFGPDYDARNWARLSERRIDRSTL